MRWASGEALPLCRPTPLRRLSRFCPVALPAGKYLEIFGRKNNLRNFWVTVGNEVTGQGPPKDDRRALEEGMRIPNAVYGRAG